MARILRAIMAAISRAMGFLIEMPLMVAQGAFNFVGRVFRAPASAAAQESASARDAALGEVAKLEAAANAKVVPLFDGAKDVKRAARRLARGEELGSVRLTPGVRAALEEMPRPELRVLAEAHPDTVDAFVRGIASEPFSAPNSPSFPKLKARVQARIEARSGDHYDEDFDNSYAA